ncbi:hypothetical protein [Pseudomonas chlororaphis]|uniref:hypothetical protein n=1 Tax=Pseudomonas chlororaphis TaxID=587753 RepID=UPI0039E451CB
MDTVISRNRQMRALVGDVVYVCGHSAHHDVGLCVGMPMQLGNDQDLWQASSLGSIYRLGDRVIQINESRVDFRPH